MISLMSGGHGRAGRRGQRVARMEVERAVVIFLGALAVLAKGLPAIEEIWFYNRCLEVICNNLYNGCSIGLKAGKDEVVPVGDFEQSLFSPSSEELLLVL